MAETETEEKKEVQDTEFQEVQEEVSSSDEPNVELLMDINLPLAVNIGQTVVPFRRLLQLGPGAVLQLDKPVGQPAELYVQDIKFATGDIVVVDGSFAVRIKEVLAGEQSDKEKAKEKAKEKKQ